MYFWIIIGIVYGTWLFLNATLQLISNIKKKQAEKQQSILTRERLQFEQKELFINYKKEVEVSLEQILSKKAKGFP